MKEFKKYKRSQICELRPVDKDDIQEFKKYNCISYQLKEGIINISISKEDMDNGSPKIGDMIACNPNDHKDQWLVAEQYFKDNFTKRKEELKEGYAIVDSNCFKFITKPYLMFNPDRTKVHLYKTLNGANNMLNCLDHKGTEGLKIIWYNKETNKITELKDL